MKPYMVSQLPPMTTKANSPSEGMEKLAAFCAKKVAELSCHQCQCGIIDPPPAPNGMESRRSQFHAGLLQFCDCDNGLRVRARFMETAEDNRYLPQDILLLRQQAEAAKRRKEKLFTDANVPPRFSSFTLNSYVKKIRGEEGKQKMVDAIKAHYAGKNKKLGIMLCGPTGMGKTGALCPLFLHYVDQGYTGLWLPYFEMMAAFKDFDGGKVGEKIAVAQDVNLLFIDDFGDSKKAQATDYEREVVFRLVDHRNNYGLPMFITSNLSVDRLEGYYRPEIVKRLEEACEVIPVTGERVR